MAVYLFEFLSENTKTQPLLEGFLSSLDCQTWKSYLKKFLPLVKIASQGELGVYPVIVVPRDEKFEENCKFIEKIILQNSDELDEYDFKSLRAKPIYKIGDGTYRIIFNLFVVEKIFKGLYFILHDVYKNFPKNNKMLGDFRGFYCDEFSEKILLYKVVESIYSDKYIRFSGEEFKDQGMKAEPDYYIRKGKNIILFESKDFLISADKKASFD